MESFKKSFRHNDRARGSVHFTEFETSELMRTLSSARLSMFDLRSTKSASERRDVTSSSGIFPPAFFYEPVITNTTMRLSVSQSSRCTTRPSSHQPHYTRPSSLEQTTKPSESIKTLSFSERQTTLPRSSVSFKVTNVSNDINIGSSSQKEEKDKSSNERIAESSSIFACNVENTDNHKEIYQEQRNEHKSNNVNDNYSNMKIWQSTPERPLSRSLFSVNESSQLRRSANVKSISMEELRSVTSRVRTFPDSALNVIYRFLRALSDEVMTLALQENMKGNEDTRLWELIYKYCASSNNNIDNDINCYRNTEVCNNELSNNNRNAHKIEMEVIPEFAAFCEPTMSLTVEHMNTNYSDNYNNLLPAIITDNESSISSNKKKNENECNNLSKLNSNMNSYLSSNAVRNKEESDTHFASEEKEKEFTFGTQSNVAANRFECLRNDSSEVRESVVKVNDSVVDKINYYVARQSFPIIEHNNKLQYSAEWFEPINAHIERNANTTIESEQNENIKSENEQESLINESEYESDTSRARVTISAEPPLYLSGMLFDPESEKFLFNGCPFLEQARLLRVSLNVDPLSSRVTTPSVRKDSATSNHGKLLVREYLTPYVSSSSSSTSLSSSTRQTKAQQQREEELLSFTKEESEESWKEKERQPKEVLEYKYSYLVQTFSIVPDNCPINVATHRTELIKPSEVTNILPFVYGGALTRLVILDPEAFATRAHSALAHRSFAGSMRLNSTLIQDLIQLRKSNALNNTSSDVNDVSLSDADKIVQIAPSNMTLHATVTLLTKLEENSPSTAQKEGKEVEEKEKTMTVITCNTLQCAQRTQDKVLGMSTERSNNEKSKNEEGNKQCHITPTSHASNLWVPFSSSASSSSVLSPPPLLSTRVGGTTNVLIETVPKKFNDSSEEQLNKLRQEKITSAKQAFVRNWEAEQDLVQLTPHSDTVSFCLQWYASRCSLLLRMHATALAVRKLQKFTRHALIKKRRALHRMCRVWGELEREAERIMRQHRPAPSSTARVEVVASLVLQEHMITTTEYKIELIEQLWQRRKRLAYAWQREFLMNTKKQNWTPSSYNEDTAVQVDDSAGNRKCCYSAFVQSILSSMDESERQKMEEILYQSSESSSSSLLESDEMNKRTTTKLRMAKDTIDNVKQDNQWQDNVNVESEAAVRTTNQHDSKQAHIGKDKYKSDSNHAKREVITWNTYNDNDDNNNNKNKTGLAAGSNYDNTENQTSQVKRYERRRCAESLVKLCELPINYDNNNNNKYSGTAKTISKTGSTVQDEGKKTNVVTESNKPYQCNRSLRSCKLISSFTPDVIRDRRVADELHNLFGWYIAPEELLYESHQRLFSSLQSTVLTLEEAQMATERHLLEKLYHHHQHKRH